MKKNNFTIAGNWKMNPGTLSEAKKLFAHYKRMANKYPRRNFVCAVPAIYLVPLSLADRPKNLILCAQNVYFEDSGSYTGSISVPMVKDAGIEMVLIGHSERRSIFGVSNEIISKKITQAIKHNIPMVVCFGETERDEEGHYTEQLRTQLEAITQPFADARKLSLLYLAYEPVWAIGAGAKRSVTEDELFSTLLLIQNMLSELVKQKAKTIPVWYGGSVNPDNAQALAKVPNVRGFLIGRASLDREKISNITEVV